MMNDSQAIWTLCKSIEILILALLFYLYFMVRSGSMIDPGILVSVMLEIQLLRAKLLYLILLKNYCSLSHRVANSYYCALIRILELFEKILERLQRLL